MACGHVRLRAVSVLALERFRKLSASHHLRNRRRGRTKSSIIATAAPNRIQRHLTWTCRPHGLPIDGSCVVSTASRSPTCSRVSAMDAPKRLALALRATSRFRFARSPNGGSSPMANRALVTLTYSAPGLSGLTAGRDGDFYQFRPSDTAFRRSIPLVMSSVAMWAPDSPSVATISCPPLLTWRCLG